MISPSKKYIIAVLIVGVIAIVFLVYRNDRFGGLKQNTDNQKINASNTGSSASAGILDKNQGIVATPIPPYRGESVGVMREGKVSSDLPKEYLASLRTELLGLAKKVSENTADFDDWMRIGIIKKVFLDYQGAADAWEYAGAVYTLNSLPFYNLGDLYGWYMKNSAKSEASFQRAIALDPKKANFYTSLADLYRLFYTVKKNLVVSTIESGLKELQNDPALFLYLGSYYRDDVKDNAKAIFYYEKVLVQDQSNSALKAEIDRLKLVK